MLLARLHVPHIAFTKTTWHFFAFILNPSSVCSLHNANKLLKKRHFIAIARLRKGQSLKYLQFGKILKSLFCGQPDVVITKAASAHNTCKLLSAVCFKTIILNGKYSE